MTHAEAGRLGGQARAKGGSKTLKRGLMKKDISSGNTGWGGTTKSKAIKHLKKQVAGLENGKTKAAPGRLTAARKAIHGWKQSGQLKNVINR